MVGIGQRFPRFALTGVVSSDPHKAFQPITHESFPGKWQVVFFWPKDFTFVCPTEIAAFGKLEKEFRARDAQLLGVSIDSEYVHLAWRREKEELRSLPFPMLADIKRELRRARYPRPRSGRGAASDLYRRPAGRDPLRLRHRPERRPQPRGSTAGA